MNADLQQLAELSTNPAFYTMTVDGAHARVADDIDLVDRYYGRLRDFAESEGFRVIDDTETDPDGGYATDLNVSGATEHKQKWVWIRGSLKPAVKFTTLLHEVGHVLVPPRHLLRKLPAAIVMSLLLMDDQASIGALSEASTESAVFLVSKALGFNNGFPEAYLGHLFKEMAPLVIAAVSDVAATTAQEILTGLGHQAAIAA